MSRERIRKIVQKKFKLDKNDEALYFFVRGGGAENNNYNKVLLTLWE